MLGYQKSAAPRTPQRATTSPARESSNACSLSRPEGSVASGRFLVPQHEPRRHTALRPRTTASKSGHFAATSITTLADFG